MKQKVKTTVSLVLIWASLACSLVTGQAPASDHQQEQTTPSGLELPDNINLRDFRFNVPLFSAQSDWNQSVDQAKVLPESDQQILITYRVLRGDTSSLHPTWVSPTTWPFMDINYDEYAIPIYRMGNSEQSVLICDYEGNLGWPSLKFPDDQRDGGPVTIPNPAGAVRPAGPLDTDADGHLVLYDPDTSTAYDLWQATTQRDGECSSWGGGQPGDQILEAGAVDFFDIRADGSNIDTYSSARATGVPLLAGLILPEEIANGEITHALAVAIPGLRNLSPDPSEPLSSDYFHPATTTETDFYNTNIHALAAGQRLRLRPTLVDEEGNPINENYLAPITQIFLAALRTYGAIVIDNAGGFSYYAEDIHSANLDLPMEQVNILIGEPVGTPLPTDKTQWQVIIEKLNQDLALIPFAYGSWDDGYDPAKASIEISNFDVIDPTSQSFGSKFIFLPFVGKTSPSDFANLPVGAQK